ncbi:MAG TPA: hypothetical protein VGA73_09760 [Candidatus Binatia bacterium]
MVYLYAERREQHVLDVRRVMFSNRRHHVAQGFAQTLKRLRIEIPRAAPAASKRGEDGVAGRVRRGALEREPAVAPVLIKHAIL